MYEIWLVMNIVYEIALGVWPLLALLLAVWVVTLVAARGRLGGRQVRQALLLGALVAVALFFSVPTLTQSSLANMGYWVDWANLLAVALGLGALAAVFSLPLLGLAGVRR
jgi:hypothetical protein